MRTPQLFLALALAISVAAPAAWSFPGFNQSQWFGHGGNRLSGYANNVNNSGANPLSGLTNINANNNGYGRRNGFLSRFMPGGFGQQANYGGGRCAAMNGGMNNGMNGGMGYNNGYNNNAMGYNNGYGNGYMNNGMGGGLSSIGQMFGGGSGQMPYGQNYNSNAYGQLASGMGGNNGQFGNGMGEFRHHHHHHQNW